MYIKQRPRIITHLALFTIFLLAVFGLGSSMAGAPVQNQTIESGPGWTLITVTDAMFEDGFGYSAAIHGDTLVVSAPGTPLPDKLVETTIGEISAGGLAGAIYVFRREGDAWMEGMKLTPADGEAGDQFGLRIALSEDTLVVSAPYKWTHSGGNAAGVVYIFKREGKTWNQQARVTAPDGAPFDLFGSALALEVDILAVSARGADSAGKTNTGAVYVYQRQGEEWSLSAKLVAEDAASRDYFGESILLTEGALVVGAPGHDERTSGDNFGAVYLFRRSGNNWQQAGKLAPPNLEENAQFGYALAINERSGTLVAFTQNKGPAPDLGPGADDYASIVNYTGGVNIFQGRGAEWRFQERLIPDQREYIPFYFVREGRVALVESGSNGEVLVSSMGEIGFYQRQGDRWIEFTPPQIPYQPTGTFLSGKFLTMSEGLLVYVTSHPVEMEVPAILLVDRTEWSETR
jgi:hypothetical protein